MHTVVEGRIPLPVAYHTISSEYQLWHEKAPSSRVIQSPELMRPIIANTLQHYLGDTKHSGFIVR